MAFGLSAVVSQVRSILQNKDATIAQLQAALATANANAIQPADTAALADLQNLVDLENAGQPIP